MYIMTPEAEAGEWSATHVRALAALMFVGYPLGCLLRFVDNAAVDAFGLALVGVSALAALRLFMSYPARVANSPVDALDERERDWQAQCYRSAFTCFAGLAVVAALYLQVAFDFGLWLPSSEDHFEAIVWGSLLFGLGLPTATVAWQQAPLDDADRAAPLRNVGYVALALLVIVSAAVREALDGGTSSGPLLAIYLVAAAVLVGLGHAISRAPAEAIARRRALGLGIVAVVAALVGVTVFA